MTSAMSRQIEEYFIKFRRYIAKYVSVGSVVKLCVSGSHSITVHVLIGLAISCIVGYIGFEILITSLNADYFTDNLDPFSGVTLFWKFCLCSIVFWHSLLFGLIVGYWRERLRKVAFRAMDYLWFSLALISAALAVNDLQALYVSNLARQLDNQIDNSVRIEREYKIKLKDACGYIRGVGRDLSSLGISRDDISEMCSNSFMGRDNVSKFVSACNNSGMVFKENDARFHDDDKLLVDHLNNIINLCVTYYDDLDYSNIKERVDQLHSKFDGVISQKSGMWILIIALAIGLRLTKTTAELVDALRS